MWDEGCPNKKNIEIVVHLDGMEIWGLELSEKFQRQKGGDVISGRLIGISIMNGWFMVVSLTVLCSAKRYFYYHIIITSYDNPI